MQVRREDKTINLLAEQLPNQILDTNRTKSKPVKGRVF
jgi:hypothetical protein